MPARGPGTFGWDPVFEYEGETYAEMSKERKVSRAPVSVLFSVCGLAMKTQRIAWLEVFRICLSNRSLLPSVEDVLLTLGQR